MLIRRQGEQLAAGGVPTRAKALCGDGGIAPERAAASVVYHQILRPAHAILLANGLPCESLYPGSFALETLPRPDRAAIAALFPGEEEDVVAAYGPLARPAPTFREIRDLPRGARLAHAGGRVAAA